MKRRAIILCKAAVFVIILSVCLHFLTDAFRVKDEANIDSGFYHYRDHSFDVISFGTSFSMNGIYPMQMWEEHGITSYNLSAGNESIGTSYYLAREAIKRQHPKLIILDCGTAYWDWKIMSNEQFRHVTDTMPLWSVNRTKMILDLADEGREALLFPFEAYHMRWTDLTQSDFEKNYKAQTLGAALSMRADGGEQFERHELAAEGALNDIQMEYIEKIRNLCEETDTQLLLLVMPVIGPSFVLDQPTFDLRRNAAYALEDYCEQEGMDILNLTDAVDELGLDPSKDTVEGGHMNMRGAAKVTAYLGNYIAEHYEMPDHRGDSRYSFMDRAYPEYQETLQEKRIQTCDQMNDFTDALRDETFRDRYLVVIASGPEACGLSEEAAEAVRSLGISQDLSGWKDQAFIAVLDGGKNVYETPLSRKQDADGQEFTQDGYEIFVKSNIRDAEECLVRINGREYHLQGQGLNILIYDKYRNRITDITTAFEKGIR